MSHQPNNVFAGTQVVSLVEARGTNNSLVHPRGAVDVVTRTPASEAEIHYPVRFSDGFEASLPRDQPDVLKLNEEFRLPYIADLVARKLAGPEKSALEDADVAFHESEYKRLRGELRTAHESSQLPELPDDKTRAALNDLLVRIRLATRVNSAAPTGLG